MALPAGAIASIAAQAAGAISAGFAGIYETKAKRGYLDALAGSYDTQAHLNDLATARQRRYINEASAEQLHRLNENAAQLQGSQTAMMAASGMDVASGSAQELFDSSRRAQEEDETLIRYQAERDAFETMLSGQLQSADLRSQARQTRLQSQMAKYQGRWNLGNTILTGSSQIAATAIDKWEPARPSGAGALEKNIAAYQKENAPWTL